MKWAKNALSSSFYINFLPPCEGGDKTFVSTNILFPNRNRKLDEKGKNRPFIEFLYKSLHHSCHRICSST